MDRLLLPIIVSLTLLLPIRAMAGGDGELGLLSTITYPEGREITLLVDQNGPESSGGLSSGGV